MSPQVQEKSLLFLIIISGPYSLRKVGPAIVVFFFTKTTTSETIWEVANKFDNIVKWIFDSALRIYLCTSTGISFVWHDSAFCLGGFLEVDTTVDMRVVGVVVIL